MIRTFKKFIIKKRFFKDHDQFFKDFTDIRNKYVDLNHEVCKDIDKVNADPGLKLVANQLDVILTVLSSDTPLAKPIQVKILADDLSHLKKVVDPPEAWFGAYGGDTDRKLLNIHIELFEKCFIPFNQTIFKTKYERIFYNLLECYSSSIGIIAMAGFSLRFDHNAQAWVATTFGRIKKMYDPKGIYSQF
jgi:hypothetical protein